MNIFTRLFADPTDFKAGGLLPMKLNHKMLRMGTPSNFIAPKKIDNRDLALPSDDQGNTSACAGYGTAGFIEIQNWKIKHYPEQVNAPAIYAAAKKIDGDNSDGTTLESATQAAINLGLYKGTPTYIDSSEGRNGVKFAIHQHSVCICGFVIDQNWNLVGSDGVIGKNLNVPRLGGHCVDCLGYDNNYVYIHNSWSASWGLYGFAQLSWEQFDAQFMCGAIIDREKC